MAAACSSLAVPAVVSSESSERSFPFSSVIGPHRFLNGHVKCKRAQRAVTGGATATRAASAAEATTLTVLFGASALAHTILFGASACPARMVERSVPGSNLPVSYDPFYWGQPCWRWQPTPAAAALGPQSAAELASKGTQIGVFLPVFCQPLDVFIRIRIFMFQVNIGTRQAPGASAGLASQGQARQVALTLPLTKT
jgi:hypothetical protein